MNKTQKLEILQNKHLGEWLKTRQKVWAELSEKCRVFCFCNRLATGFHEDNCRKFQDKITSETIERLKHLWIKS